MYGAVIVHSLSCLLICQEGSCVGTAAGKESLDRRSFFIDSISCLKSLTASGSCKLYKYSFKLYNSVIQYDVRKVVGICRSLVFSDFNISTLLGGTAMFIFTYPIELYIPCVPTQLFELVVDPKQTLSLI